MRKNLAFRDLRTGRFLNVFEACRLPNPRVHVTHIRITPRKRRFTRHARRSGRQ